MASARTTTSTAPAAPRLAQPFPSGQRLAMNGAAAVMNATHEQLQVATQVLPPVASAPAAHQLKPLAVNLVLAARAVRRRAVGRGLLPPATTCPAPAAALQQRRIGQRIARLASLKVRPIAPRTPPHQALLLPLAMAA